MFVQKLWAEYLPWDIELAEDLSSWWKQYRSALQRLLDIEIPRRVIRNTHHQYTLHCFCDASKGGYGCSIYVVSPDLSGTLQSRLLTSKSRVASLKGHSIPRYELCAALLGSQLVENLRKTTVYTQPAIFWSDSTIVLYWIKSPSHKWKVFVSNRIAEIQRLTKDCQWRHIPTELNPADKVSRGVLASEIVGDELWFHGPGFLTSPVEQWPDSKVLIRLVQRSTFHLEMQIYDLKRTSSSTKTVSSRSPLKNLNLFMDEFGLLRLNSLSYKSKCSLRHQMSNTTTSQTSTFLVDCKIDSPSNIPRWAWSGSCYAASALLAAPGSSSSPKHRSSVHNLLPLQSNA
ncbi:uncharacterized protein LOC129752139 [Uranotaenia lowii]|uniref:uncharacterized protein LOC129752139 n=1 Tax=Uranotaenia lowii TaxID=190385 RepID=UPI0024791A6F|nr:uncharacterized protein LOC129752139 [Uranotaenia lowii]